MAKGGKVTTTHKADWVFLADGYAIPGRFKINAAIDLLTVELDVEVVDGKVRPFCVSASTEDPRGVSATLLRTIPVRDLVGSGVQNVLARLAPTASGESAKIVPVREWGEDEVLATKRLVRYLQPEAKQ